MNNYLFVYPSINYKKKGINIYRFDGTLSLENFFEVKNKNFFKNNEYIVISKKAYDYIYRHNGTWQRWLRNEVDNINKFRELHRLVLKIIIWLKEKKISKVIQFTAAPHHVDTSLIEIASRIIAIKSIFFYCENVITRTYLPIYRDEFKFEYLHFDKLKNSSKEIKKVISEWKGNLRINKRDDWTREISFYKKNILIASLYIFYWHIKKKFFDIKVNNFVQKEIGLLGDLKSLINQRKYLKYLSSKNQINKCQLGSETNNIIIYGHYQPESTTLSEGGDFRDQIDILKFLKQSGYTGNIFYKEHKCSSLYIERIIGPTRVGLWKNKNFYNNLNKYNAKLILEDSGISNSIIITCTGSIAIERSLQGLRTVVCGYPWYGDIPGTVRLEDVKWDDKNLVNSLIGSSEKIIKDSENYLANLLSYGLIKDLNEKNAKLNCFHTMKDFFDLFLN